MRGEVSRKLLGKAGSGDEGDFIVSDICSRLVGLTDKHFFEGDSGVSGCVGSRDGLGGTIVLI